MRAAVAAAASVLSSSTAAIFGVTSAPSKTVDLVIDRPLLFAIRDDATGALLFFGRLNDPV
jgi:serine protease inhibitor